MSCARLLPLATGLLLLAATANARPPRSHGKATTHATIKHGSARSKATAHTASTATMPSERATEIQAALIRQGYLTGEPSGAWDAPTVAAMQKMQEDNGWQSKITPDSRALIKLGLGGPENPPQ